MSDEKIKREYSFTNGEVTITGDTELQRVVFGAMLVLGKLGEMKCSLEEIHAIGKVLEAATSEEVRGLLEPSL